MLFYTPSSKYLADQIALPKGSAEFQQFSDGEWHVTISDDVYTKSVWVLACTGAPADNIVQLLLLLDALVRAGAKPSLLISYFGYARQDVAQKGQALSAEVMCKLLQTFCSSPINVVHLHNPKICNSIKILNTARPEPVEGNVRSILKNHIPYHYFYERACEVDVIAAPDQGAEHFARHIAQHEGKELVVLKKHRPEPEKVVIRLSGDVQGKKVLIVDDMITTGGTILKAASLLREHGACSVQVAATHGVFAGDAIKKLIASDIEKIYVTNTLPQKDRPAKITVVNIAPFIERIMKAGE